MKTANTARAILRDVRLSPQKARLVVDQIRGMSVDRALSALTFNPQKAATVIEKLVRSAIANAENNHALDVDRLVISETFVDAASTFKRTMPRAKGRANRITKRQSHITVVVTEK